MNSIGCSQYSPRSPEAFQSPDVTFSGASRVARMNLTCQYAPGETSIKFLIRGVTPLRTYPLRDVSSRFLYQHQCLPPARGRAPKP